MMESGMVEGRCLRDVWVALRCVALPFYLLRGGWNGVGSGNGLLTFYSELIIISHPRICSIFPAGRDPLHLHHHDTHSWCNTQGLDKTHRVIVTCTLLWEFQ